MRLEFILAVDVKPLTKFAEIDPMYRREIEKTLVSQIQRVLDPKDNGYEEGFCVPRRVSIEGCDVHFYNVAPREQPQEAVSVPLRRDEQGLDERIS